MVDDLVNQMDVIFDETGLYQPMNQDTFTVAVTPRVGLGTTVVKVPDLVTAGEALPGR